MQCQHFQNQNVAPLSLTDFDGMRECVCFCASGRYNPIDMASDRNLHGTISLVGIVQMDANE